MAVPHSMHRARESAGSFRGRGTAGISDTSELLAPPKPRTLPKSPDTAGTSDTFEVLVPNESWEPLRTPHCQNPGHFRGPRSAKISNTTEVLAPPESQTLSRTLHRRNLKNLRGPRTAGISKTSVTGTTGPFEVLAPPDFRALPTPGNHRMIIARSSRQGADPRTVARA